MTERIRTRQHPGSTRSSILPVRATMAEYLRAGLYREIGLAAQQLAEISLLVRDDTRESDVYVRAIDRMDAARELLEEIGWQPAHATVRVAIGRYRPLVLFALRQQLDHQVEELPNVLPAQRSDAERRIGELGDYILYLQSLPG
jgi:hypothetical protein